MYYYQFGFKISKIEPFYNYFVTKSKNCKLDFMQSIWHSKIANYFQC